MSAVREDARPLAPLTAQEQVCFGRQAQVVRRGADGLIVAVEADGSVLRTCYPVFPGIRLLYNDVHAAACTVERLPHTRVLEIDHCREGRVEHQEGESSTFLAPGDLSVRCRDAGAHVSRFPTGHYHGITVSIDLDAAPRCLSCLMEDVEVEPRQLAEKFCPAGRSFTARSSPRVAHVFSELYEVPPEIRRGYCKVKVLELLLFLRGLPLPREEGRYTAAQVALARQVSDYLLAHAEQRPTIQELAERFRTSPTQLKNSFRGVFGMSPAAYIRAQKMHRAAALLRETDRTVLDIAGSFGYDNGSKFAKAFRDVIGVSPNAYRSGLDRDTCAPT